MVNQYLCNAVTLKSFFYFFNLLRMYKEYVAYSISLCARFGRLLKFPEHLGGKLLIINY